MYIFVALLILSRVFTVSYGEKRCPRYPEYRRSYRPFESRISGGTVAGMGDIPYQAEIRGNEKSCSGTIIHKRWVLTAAHCYHIPQWAKDVLVYYRLTDRNDPYRSVYCRKVSSIIVHDEYTTNLNDITLIKVNKDIKLNEQVQVLPALIREYEIDDIAGREAIVSGWGTITETQDSEQSRYLEVKVLSKVLCVLSFGDVGKPDAVLCAQADNEEGNICGGDSRGPLVLKGTRHLIGVVTFSAGESCGENYPMGFMNVSHYRNWIIDKIAPDVLP